MRRDTDMRYWVVWLAGLLVLFSASSLPATQQLPEWMGPPSVGPPPVAEFSSDEPCAPLYRRGGGLSFFAGYMDHAKGLNLSFDPTTNGYQPDVLLERWQHNYPLRGLWLSLEADLPLPAGLGFYASGSYLFPSVVYSEEFVSWETDRGSRSWSTSTQWFTVDAAGSYSANEAVRILGGVRYESLFTKFFNPSNTVNLAALPTDDAEVNLSLIIPYVGLAVGQGSGRSGMKLRALISPYIAGDVVYGETYGIGEGDTGSRNEVRGGLDRGYFLELTAEALYGPGGGTLMFGAFGKYQYLHARGELPGEYHSAGLPTASDRFQFGVLRQAWVVGGVASLNFASPF